MTNEHPTFDSHSQVYRANRPLMIPQGPGVVPSTIRFMKGELFELDGDEPIRVSEMLRMGAISKWKEGDPEPNIEPSEADKRRVRRKRRRRTE